MKDMNLLTPDLHDFSDLGISFSAIGRTLRGAIASATAAAIRAGRAAGRDLAEFGRAAPTSGPIA